MSTMVRRTLLWLLLLPLTCYGVELRELSIVYERFYQPNFIPELYGRTAKEAVAFNLNMDLAQWGPVTPFWHNRVHSLTDSGQYRLVGWEVFLGLAAWDLELAYHHHSQHLLEALPPGHFPVRDSFYLKWYVIGGH